MSTTLRCLGLAWLGCLGCTRPLPPSDPHPELDRVPEPMVATALDGASIELPEQGHVTIVEVWATWCEPCRVTMPEVERLWRDGRSAGLRVVGVATDDNPGLVANAIRRSDVTYPNVVDAGGQVRGWLRLSDLPTVVVFDRRGRIRWVHRGAANGGSAAIGDVVASLERERE